MTERTLADRVARRMMEAGHPLEVVIAEFLREGTLDRIKSITRLRPYDEPGARLFDPGGAGAGALWMRAEIVAAVATALSYGHLTPDTLREEVDRALELVGRGRQRP